jgi:hypothetical protein
MLSSSGNEIRQRSIAQRTWTAEQTIRGCVTVTCWASLETAPGTELRAISTRRELGDGAETRGAFDHTSRHQARPKQEILLTNASSSQRFSTSAIPGTPYKQTASWTYTLVAVSSSFTQQFPVPLNDSGHCFDHVDPTSFDPLILCNAPWSAGEISNILESILKI